MENLSQEFIDELKKSITGELNTDPITRVLYSTDASIHKMEPLGVVFPRNLTELDAIVKLSARNNIPLIPRGSGSSLAGQSIGNGLIIDCSRYLRHLININREEMSAVVEPGLILDDLNRTAKKYGLIFGPDPASSERATLGGCIGNNATGAHSIIYGMTADHMIEAEVVLADGSVTTLMQKNTEEIEAIGQGTQASTYSKIEANIYHTALQIQKEYQEEIKKTWPLTWRRTSGYNLNYLIPWSPTAPPQWNWKVLPYPPVATNTINLAQVLVGSEGTLGILRKAKIRLVPIKRNKLLSVVSFSSIEEACSIVPEILELSPAAVELIPQSLIHLARSVPMYASQLSFVRGDPAAMLVVEFSGDDSGENSQKVAELRSLRKWTDEPYVAKTPAEQKQVWDVRNVGLGILMSRQGDIKPVTFIEDLSVPVERLGEFVRGLESILKDHGTTADYYGHASAGCLHIRPLLNIKTASGRKHIRSIAEAAVQLVLSLNGAISAEHGDGITRGEWIERAYGPRIVQAMLRLKTAADPNGILNPGKILSTPRMDTFLRYDEAYHTNGWEPVMVFSSKKPDPIKLVEAIEQCNGVGVCRKSEGVMCPSFQATLDEKYSTRGRANLLRAMVSNGLTPLDFATQAVKETLDKCLACKGCKAECPSAVDMAKLKYEFSQYYYSQPGHHHPIRDYLFGYIGNLLYLGHFLTPVANFVISGELLSDFREKLLGLSKKRRLPRLSDRSFHSMVKDLFDPVGKPDVLLLSDAFNEHFYPQTGLEAMAVLKVAGCNVRVLKTIGAGRTFISKGFLLQARMHALKLLKEIKQVDPDGKLPIIGLEPSEIYTLKDEYPDLLPNDPLVETLAQRTFMVDEFLLRPGRNGSSWISRIKVNINSNNRTDVLIHGHCYQKAQPPSTDGLPVGTAATAAVLEQIGYQVTTIQDGCCGMAGAFGYEVEHYDLSMQVGGLSMFPAIKHSNTSLIVAAGISCKSQIEDGTGHSVVHPISLVAQRVAS